MQCYENAKCELVGTGDIAGCSRMRRGFPCSGDVWGHSRTGGTSAERSGADSRRLLSVVIMPMGAPPLTRRSWFRAELAGSYPRA